MAVVQGKVQRFVIERAFAADRLAQILQARILAARTRVSLSLSEASWNSTPSS